MIKGNGMPIGSRTLNRQMKTKVRMGSCCVVHESYIGQDEGIHAYFSRFINGFYSLLPMLRNGKGIDCKEQSLAVFPGIAHTFQCLFRTEIKTRKIAGIGPVTETDIDRIGDIINSGTQGREVPSWADQFHFFVQCWHVRSVSA